jgi:hypothetical protein
VNRAQEYHIPVVLKFPPEPLSEDSCRVDPEGQLEFDLLDVRTDSDLAILARKVRNWFAG